MAGLTIFFKKQTAGEVHSSTAGVETGTSPREVHPQDKVILEGDTDTPASSFLYDLSRNNHAVK